jgi:hypothetical protein
MPALTNLDLEDSIPPDSGGLSTSTNLLVDLPCLRVLRIWSDVGALTTVLRYITFPSTAVLKLTCRKTPAKVDFSNFLSVLATKYLSSLAIRCLTLQNLDITVGLRFLVWTTVADFRGPAQLELDLTCLLSLEIWTKTLAAVLDVLNLSTLTELRISNGDYIDSKIWLKTFGKLPLLERAHIMNSYTVPSFLSALVYKTEAAEKSQTAYHDVSFPKLRYIHLEDVDFNETNIEPGLFDMLMDCLIERYERHAEVQGLRLGDCYNLSEEHVNRLEEIVVDVIWDGIEQIDSIDYGSEEDRVYDTDGNTIYDMD